MSKLVITKETRDLFGYFYINFPPAKDNFDTRRYMSTDSVCQWLKLIKPTVRSYSQKDVEDFLVKCNYTLVDMGSVNDMRWLIKYNDKKV